MAAPSPILYWLHSSVTLHLLLFSAELEAKHQHVTFCHFPFLLIDACTFKILVVNRMVPTNCQHELEARRKTCSPGNEQLNQNQDQMSPPHTHTHTWHRYKWSVSFQMGQKLGGGMVTVKGKEHLIPYQKIVGYSHSRLLWSQKKSGEDEVNRKKMNDYYHICFSYSCTLSHR